MPRQVFLSFLGTSNYVPCNYYFENNPSQKIENVRFIQEALIKLNCSHFTENDLIITFCTDKSYRQNYLDNGHFDFKTNLPIECEGLETRLKKLGEQIPFEEIRVAEGFSEAEIWEIFEIVSNSLYENDEVYFDITHAFRFLPMMGLVLINYLKATKNISLKAIHYGAFEKLGIASEVQKMNLEHRNAPILNLTALIELNDWTLAASNFSKYGIVNDLQSLANKDLRNLIKLTEGKDKTAKSLQFVINTLAELSFDIQTNRGNSLIRFDKLKLSEAIQSIESENITIKPLKELFSLIESKFKPLVETKYIWLESAKWCLQHNLIQQGITQVQEGIITQLIINLKHHNPTLLSTEIEVGRTIISSVLNIIRYNTEQEKWSIILLNEITLVQKLMQESIMHDFASLFSKYSDLRNDINHGGYSKFTEPKKFKDGLASFIEHTEKILLKYL